MKKRKNGKKTIIINRSNPTNGKSRRDIRRRELRRFDAQLKRGDFNNDDED